MKQLKSLTRHAKRSAFFRAIATLSSGRLISISITFFSTPVIARLFAPEDVGVVSLFTTIVMFIAGISPLCYDRAAIVASKNLDSEALLALSVRLLTVISAVLLALLVFLNISGLPLPLESKLGIWIWLAPAGVWLASVSLVLKSALTKQGEFKPIMRSGIGQTVILVGSRISAGAATGSSVWALVLSKFAGLLGQIYLLRGEHTSARRLLSLKVSWARLKEVAVEYRDFPLFSFPSMFAMRLSSKLPYFMIGGLFPPAVLGFYAMSDRLVKMPIGALGSSIQRVYLKRVSDIRKRQKSVFYPFLKATTGLLVAGILPFGVLWLYGGDILDIVLGERWHGAGRYVEILAAWYFATWVAIAAQPTMIVLRKQATWLRLQLVVLAFRLASFGYAWLIDASAVQTLSIFSLVNLVVIFSVLAVCFFIAAREQEDSFT